MTETIENSSKSTDWSDETKDKYAGIIRSLNEHENILLNMRFSWFTTLQGLLFASLGFMWKDKSLPIIAIIGMMGIVVCISFISVRLMGKSAQKNLSIWWEENLKDYHGPPQKGLELPDHKTFTRYLRPWRMLPVAFMVAWLLILAYCIL